MCKRCYAYEGGPKHQRKMQLDLLYRFDTELLKEELTNFCRVFKLNLKRVYNKIAAQGPEFMLF